MLLDGFAATLLRLPWRRPRLAWHLVKLTAAAYFPLGFLHHGLWYTFLGFHGIDLAANAMGTPVDWGPTVAATMPVIDFVTVVLLAPNVLRSFCLNLVSSNMHYFGDVEKGNVMQQTQVLNRWYLLPLQLFCCNFGSTHAIHHFWVTDPFYLRQAIAPAAHRAFRAHGVRFNDLGTFRRANRWAEAA